MCLNLQLSGTDKQPSFLAAAWVLCLAVPDGDMGGPRGRNDQQPERQVRRDTHAGGGRQEGRHVKARREEAGPAPAGEEKEKRAR